MILRIRISILAASLLVAGCATEDPQWVRDDTPQSEADRALAQCKYEAEAATATVGANNHPATFGDAVSEGVASGVARGMEEADLVKSCMKARGFRR